MPYLEIGGNTHEGHDVTAKDSDGISLEYRCPTRSGIHLWIKKGNQFMKLFKFFIALLFVGTVFGSCGSMQLKEEAASVPAGHMRVSVINDRDVVMCHNTVWLNHNIPGIYGPLGVCGAEIQPGQSQTFDRNISSWHFEGTRIYRTNWYKCSPCQSDKRYDSRVVSEIPENTAIIKIYHDHYEAIPR